MRTLNLPEYQQLLAVPLSSAEVTDLAAFVPRQLSLVPSLTGNAYDLTANSWVGTIATHDLSLVLQPKVPVSRLLFLLSYTLDPKRWRDLPFDYAQVDDLAEAIIPGFAHQVRRAVQRGLLQGYRTHADSLSTVRGRVDFDEQLRRRYGRTPPVEVIYDEFTEDIAENRLLKAAVHRLRRLRLRSAASRHTLRSLDNALDRVRLEHYDARQIPTIRFSRLNEHYRPAVELARLILRATSINPAHGQSRSSTFLVNMNTVFEEFITVALREALGADERSFPPQNRAPDLRLDDQHRVRLKPDLTWVCKGRRTFIGDVKYKNLGNTDFYHRDLYQALAYAIAAGLPSALLIYAAGEAQDATHRIPAADKHVYVRTLDVSVEPEEVLEQVAAIAQVVRGLATGPHTERRRNLSAA
jgi:5-methylcytosine-specific restriction enzyme subunit McrC